MLNSWIYSGLCCLYLLVLSEAAPSPGSQATANLDQVIKAACGYYYETDSSECGDVRVCGYITPHRSHAIFANRCIINGYICLSGKVVNHVGMQNCGSNSVYYTEGYLQTIQNKDYNVEPLMHMDAPVKPPSILRKFEKFLGGLSAMFSEISQFITQ